MRKSAGFILPCVPCAAMAVSFDNNPARDRELLGETHRPFSAKGAH
jgi:hypothetical protein